MSKSDVFVEQQSNDIECLDGFLKDYFVETRKGSSKVEVPNKETDGLRKPDDKVPNGGIEAAIVEKDV